MGWKVSEGSPSLNPRVTVWQRLLKAQHLPVGSTERREARWWHCLLLLGDKPRGFAPEPCFVIFPPLEMLSRPLDPT